MKHDNNTHGFFDLSSQTDETKYNDLSRMISSIVQSGRSCFVYAQKNTKHHYVKRFMEAIAGLKANTLEDSINQKMYDALTKPADELGNMPIYFDETIPQSIERAISSLKAKEEYGTLGMMVFERDSCQFSETDLSDESAKHGISIVLI